MTETQGVAGTKRRTQAEIARLVNEYGSSGMRTREFCQSRGLALSTLQRHLKQQREKGDASGGSSGLMAVEVVREKARNWSLAVVLEGGGRIEVQVGFDEATLIRLLKLLARG